MSDQGRLAKDSLGTFESAVMGSAGYALLGSAMRTIANIPGRSWPVELLT